MADDKAIAFLVDSWVPVEDSELVRFENLVKSKLPAEYRAFILNKNGGRFTVNVHYHSEVDCGIHEFFSFNCPEELEWRDIECVWRVHVGRIPADTIPIARIGEDLLLINTQNGHVLYWERDRELHSHPEDNQVLIAESFETLLRGLQAEDLAERRRDSLERDEPYISIIAHDDVQTAHWLLQTDLKELPSNAVLRLFKIACDFGNIRVARQLLNSVVDPRSSVSCRLADEAGFGDIILAMLEAGATPRDFSNNGYLAQESTLAILDAWKAGRFPK